MTVPPDIFVLATCLALKYRSKLLRGKAGRDFVG